MNVEELDRRYWAKSPRAGEVSGEFLTAHTLAVVDRLLAWGQSVPDLGALSAEPRLWRRLILAAACHDLGKGCPGFQTALRDRRSPFLLRHELFSVLFLPWILGDDPHDDLAPVALSILTHHRDLNDEAIGPVLRRTTAGAEAQLVPPWPEEVATLFREVIWPAVLARTGRLLSGLRGDLDGPVPPDLRGALRRVNGSILQVRDLLEDSPPAEVVTLHRLLRGALIIADHCASAHQQFGGLRARTGPLIAGRPYSHQAASAEVNGHACLLAPTGSGKTEAAILWFEHQRQLLGYQPKLVYTLPYQASMNATRLRLEEERAFGGGTVSLRHSRSLQALYAQYLAQDECPKAAAARARLAANLERLYALPVRVMSPYPLLAAAYGLPGHETQWADLTGACFVLDELHAYEPQRLGRILATVRHLAVHHACRFFIMSATLPSRLVGFVGEVLPGLVSLRAGEALLRSFCRHRIELLNEDLASDEVLARIAAHVGAGQSPLVVATTVERAKGIARQLREKWGLPVELLHGRFHARDRNDIERRIAESRGVGAASRRAITLVATQVVEVSLNVDFDALFSDPAPLEALLQRFGRVNRKAGPYSGTQYPVYVSRVTPPKSPVYRDELIELALAQLSPLNGQPLDEARVPGMLDAVYASAYGEAWERELRESFREFQDDVLLRVPPYLRAPADLEEQFHAMFEGLEVLPRGLRAEYEALRRSNPLEAPALLVPVSFRQYGRLRRVGSEYPAVVDCQYGVDGLEIGRVTDDTV